MIDQQKISQDHLDIGTLPLAVTAIQNNSSKTTWILDIEKVAKEKWYEKITPLWIWYLGHKYHEYKWEYGQEYYYTYELLSQKLEKIKRINLPDWSEIKSPQYGWSNDKNIIITYGILAPVYKKYALFNNEWNPIEIKNKNNEPLKRVKLYIDPRNKNVIFLRKSEVWPAWMIDQTIYTISIVWDDGVIQEESEQISELHIQLT
jgi:hypothetical protein